MTTKTLPELKTLALDLSAVEALSAKELAALHDALEAARGGLQGVYNQPRCEGRPIWEVLDAVIDWLSEAANLVGEIALQREPGTQEEAEELAWLEINRRAAFGESLAEMAALVSARAAMVARVAQ